MTTKLSKKQVKEKIGQFINVCPNCRHKQYTYTQQCEECGFSWQRYFAQEFSKK